MGEVMSAVLSQEGIDILTHLPKGNAEAELMTVVPVFYVFHYLEAGSNWNIFSPNSLMKKQSLKNQLKQGKKNSILHVVHKNLVIFKLREQSTNM